MSLPEEQIAEIADMLDGGMIAHYHLPTGEIEWLPDVDDPYFDPELWQELIDKIEDDWDNYAVFEQMSSRQAFQVMEDFAHAVPDPEFKNKALERLERRKPFQNFKDLVDHSEYRQDWFDFKQKAYIAFVKEQIEEFNVARSRNL